VTLATNGQGRIDLSPAGGIYQSHTTVSATATPAPGQVFTGWSGSASGTNGVGSTFSFSAIWAVTAWQLPDPLPPSFEDSGCVSARKSRNFRDGQDQIGGVDAVVRLEFIAGWVRAPGTHVFAHGRAGCHSHHILWPFHHGP